MTICQKDFTKLSFRFDKAFPDPRVPVGSQLRGSRRLINELRRATIALRDAIACRLRRIRFLVGLTDLNFPGHHL
jgi:hypothetical protein